MIYIYIYFCFIRTFINPNGWSVFLSLFVFISLPQILYIVLLNNCKLMNKCQYGNLQAHFENHFGDECSPCKYNYFIKIRSDDELVGPQIRLQPC